MSHIGAEKNLAIPLKDLVEKSFLGMATVFVSSDERSIGMGQKWLEEITAALKTCAVELILCSPASLKRPWINFEAGAGWVRGINVIPLCHSGVIPSALPVPLNMLQAASLREPDEMAKVFSIIAKTLDCAMPTVDFSEFTKHTLEFEQLYGKGLIEIIHEVNDRHLAVLKVIIANGCKRHKHDSDTQTHFKKMHKEGTLHLLQVEQSELAKSTGLEHGQAIEAMQQLEKMELVQHNIHGFGGGFKWYSLTPKGLDYSIYKGLF